MKTLQRSYVWLLLVLLAGCGSLGQTVMPQTADQKVYAAYGLYVSLVNTTADMLAIGTLDQEQGKVLQSKFNLVRPQLDRLKGMVDGGLELPQTELETLQLIQRVLLEVQLELQARKQP